MTHIIHVLVLPQSLKNPTGFFGIPIPGTLLNQSLESLARGLDHTYRGVCVFNLVRTFKHRIPGD